MLTFDGCTVTILISGLNLLLLHHIVDMELGHPEWLSCLHDHLTNGVAAKSCQFLAHLLKDYSLEDIRPEGKGKRERERGVGSEGMEVGSSYINSVSLAHNLEEDLHCMCVRNILSWEWQLLSQRGS